MRQRQRPYREMEEIRRDAARKRRAHTIQNFDHFLNQQTARIRAMAVEARKLDGLGTYDEADVLIIRTGSDVCVKLARPAYVPEYPYIPDDTITWELVGRPTPQLAAAKQRKSR